MAVEVAQKGARRLNREDVEVHRTAERYKFLRWVVGWAGAISLAYVGIALPFKFGAGKETTLRYFLDVVGNLHLDFALSSAAATLFLTLWLRERKTSRKAIDREHKRLLELEKVIDRTRSSSGFKG